MVDKLNKNSNQITRGAFASLEIPIEAEVQCAGERCGRSIGVILKPDTRQVTHVVVQETGFPYLKRLVPVELITDSTSQLICLNCTQSQLATLKPVLEIEYTVRDAPYFTYEVDKYRTWPYDTAVAMPVSLEQERVSSDELTIHKGTAVKAMDGQVGQVDEFLVDPANGDITHLVLQEGHLWYKKYVAVPISEIERFDQDVMYLKLDKHTVEALPEFPIRRRHPTTHAK